MDITGMVLTVFAIGVFVGFVVFWVLIDVYCRIQEKNVLIEEEEELKQFLKDYWYGVASRSHKRVNFIVGEEN